LSALLYPDLKSDANVVAMVAGDLLQETRYAQPALVALEYCISEVWKSKGMRPSIVIGHSIGEYAAAVVAGVMSIEDCLHLVCDRGQFMHQSVGCKGCMVAIRATDDDVRQAIRDVDASSEASIAAINGTLSLVLSGSEQAVTRVLSCPKLTGVMHRKLNVNHAFHSPLTECMLEDYRKSFDSVKLQKPLIQIISTVRGLLTACSIAVLVIS
jgi:acyl transferase domain-containing protein